MCRILVVDDNNFERQALINVLKKIYVDVEILDTDSGNEALKIMEHKLINVLITDIKMPLMSGIELIGRVRSLDKKVNVVIISGYDDFSFVKKALPLHVENYILKPVNPVEIKETLSRLIEIPSEKKPNLSNSVKQVVEIIDKDYAENLSLENIAERIYLSTAYLGTLFTRELGVTFNQYLTSIRMDKAAELLENTTFKMATIATLVGVSNPSYFNKIFKQKFDVTPAEFRKNPGTRG